MRAPFDSRLDHDIDRSPNDQQVLDIVPANKAEAAVGVDLSRLHDAQALLAPLFARVTFTSRAGRILRAVVGVDSLAALIDELGEAIDEDLSRAEPPREGDPKKLASLLNELKSQRMPALTRAAKAKDASAYRGSFANAAKTCNACHEATGHPFVEVPEVPGGSVPRLDPRDAGL